MSKKSVPRRGEIWLVKLDKERPVLVIQANELTEELYKIKRKDIIVLEITTKCDKWTGWPIVVFLSKNAQNRLKEDSCIRCNQIWTIDDSAIVHKIGILSDEKIAEIEQALLYGLGIEI